MKFTPLIILLTFGITGYSQVKEELQHCNCSDRVESLSPVPNGIYERTCSGKIIETGSFNNGKKDGIWTTYSKSGKMIRKMTYKNDSLDGSVELYYPNGKPKLTASFVNNKRNGIWTYFSEKGKVRINGEYELDKPINTWTVKDVDGKSVRVQFDFNTSTFLKNEPVSYHKDWDVLQNDNSAEFFILLYPERINFAGTAPIGGFFFANDLFVDLMEIPLEFWDTYTHKLYTVNYSISADHISGFSLNDKEDFNESAAQYTFLAKTNDTPKLKKVEFNDLSNLLLMSKVNETLLFMPPWIYQNTGEVKVQIPYVINDIEGIEVIEK